MLHIKGLTIIRRSHRRCSIKGVLKNFAEFTGKYLCQSLFFNKKLATLGPPLLKKRLWHKCFLDYFKNTCFEKHRRKAASEAWILHPLWLKQYQCFSQRIISASNYLFFRSSLSNYLYHHILVSSHLLCLCCNFLLFFSIFLISWFSHGSNVNFSLFFHILVPYILS